MRSLQVLVVDDEPAIRQVLAAQIAKAGHAVEHVGSGEEALERTGKGDIDVVVCDLRLPGIDGIEVMRRTLASGADTVFLMITAYASVNTAIEAMKAGAFDYLIKPLRGEDVLYRLDKVADLIQLRDENRRLKRLAENGGARRCECPSEAMREVDRLVAKVAVTEGTVLITGESGTGKGMVARAIHEQSRRAQTAFIPVNCGAIPETLMETEFFGHLKGAFTGAERAKKGLFLEADKGTIFLDEVGELPLNLQVKLLHAIEDREVRAVGSERTRRIDVRIIAATNRDIHAMVESGRLREDLYYRLNVLHIHLPPLRERPADILPLTEFFLRREAERIGIERRMSLEQAVVDILQTYAWPGNVRELQNVVARALILADSDRILPEDLPPRVVSGLAGGRGRRASDGPITLKEKVHLFEVEMIRQAIKREGGDRQAAARVLGIGLSTLYRKLEEREWAHRDRPTREGA